MEERNDDLEFDEEEIDYLGDEETEEFSHNDDDLLGYDDDGEPIYKEYDEKEVFPPDEEGREEEEELSEEGILAEFQQTVEDDSGGPIPEQFKDRDLTEKLALKVRMEAFNLKADMDDEEDIWTKKQLREAAIRKIKSEASTFDLIQGARDCEDYTRVKNFLRMALGSPEEQDFYDSVYPSLSGTKTRRDTITRILSNY